MLQRTTTILPRGTRDEELPGFHSPDRLTVGSLNGRLLLRYVPATRLGLYANGSDDQHWLTPTAYDPCSAQSWLALPSPQILRRHVMLIDPFEVLADSRPIAGPRWVRFGGGIEYLLPRGFPKSALALGWEMEVR